VRVVLKVATSALAVPETARGAAAGVQLESVTQAPSALTFRAALAAWAEWVASTRAAMDPARVWVFLRERVVGFIVVKRFDERFDERLIGIYLANKIFISVPCK
jgi:hypothetical protein